MLRSRWDGWRRVRGHRVYRCAKALNKNQSLKLKEDHFNVSNSQIVSPESTSMNKKMAVNLLGDSGKMAESAAEERADSLFLDSGDICLVSNFAFNDPIKITKCLVSKKKFKNLA